MNRQIIPRWGAAPPMVAASQHLQPDRRWDLLLVCLAGYVLTAVGRVHQLVAFLEPLHLAFAAAACAIALFLLDSSRARRLRPVFALPTTRFVLGLLLWVALSVPGALWPGGSFTQFVALAKTVAMYLVIVGAARGARDVERLAGVYFLCAAFYGAVILSRFQVDQDAWRLGNLYYYDANDFATFAVSAMPIGLYLVVRRGAILVRLGAATGMAILSVAFVWSGSRGGFLAVLATAMFLLLRFTALRLRWRVLIVSALAVVVVMVASDQYWQQMKTITTPAEDYNLKGEVGRVNIWKRGLGYILSHPMLGLGAGDFPVAEGTISPQASRRARGRGVPWNAAHNSFVQAGAELGIPGLVLFIGMLVAAFRALQRSRRRSPHQTAGRHDQFAQALTAALLGFTVGAFFLSLAYAELLYCLVALAGALGKATSSMTVDARLMPRA